MRQQRYKLWYHPTVYDQLNVCISSISEITQCPDSVHQYLMKEYYLLFIHEDLHQWIFMVISVTEVQIEGICTCQEERRKISVRELNEAERKPTGRWRKTQRQCVEKGMRRIITENMYSTQYNNGLPRSQQTNVVLNLKRHSKSAKFFAIH